MTDPIVIDLKVDPARVTEVRFRIIPTPTVPPTAPPHIKGEMGIDVSKWQGTIDWDRVAASNQVGFAGIRATTGATGKDIQFARNWAESRRVGIQRMAYHYYVNGLEPISQLNNFLSTLGNDLGELPLILDIEPRNISTDPNVTVYETINKPRNTNEIHHWLQQCAGRTGKAIAIYCSAWSLGMCTTYPAPSMLSWLGGYHLWIAHHTTAPAPRIPTPWTKYLVWQYSQTGRVSGIANSDGTPANVDLDRWGEL